MADRTGRSGKGLAVAALVVAAVFLVSVNSLSNSVLGGASLDFTENSIYTLSDGTREVLGSLEEPVTLRYFYSDSLGEAVPAYAAYAGRVRELLERYADLAGGKLRLEIYNPQPFSEEEDLAVELGLEGVTLNQAGEEAYFGVAGANTTDDEELIPFLHPDREAFLEYDLTRLINTLAHPDRPVVAVVAGLPMMGARPNMMTGQPGSPPWTVVQQIQEQYEVRPIGPDVERIDPDVDVLMLVHPKDLPSRLLYAIDQYVLGGGKVLAFLDPHAEADPAGRRAIGVPGATASDLGPLLQAWGITMASDTVVGDRSSAIRVTAQLGDRPTVTDYVVWMSLGEDRLNGSDAVTGDLSLMNLGSAGHIQRLQEATTQVTPLLTTSNESMEIDADRVRFVPDPAGLLAEFKSEGRPFVLAARVQGPAETAFPDGPPPEDGEEGAPRAATNEGADDAEEAESPAPHRAESEGDINLIVVADSDLLRDQFWVQTQSFLGQTVVTRTAGNGDFVINAIDNLSGGGALIGLRSRGVASRPFTLIEEIRRDAEQRLRAKERELQDGLAEVESKLAEVQTSEGDGSVILSDEQNDAVASFTAQMLDIRKQLRQVRLALREDIDRLESVVRFVNIALIPILIGMLAVVLALVRQRRRARAQRMV